MRWTKIKERYMRIDLCLLDMVIQLSPMCTYNAMNMLFE